MSQHLTWLLSAISVAFSGLLLANPGQILLAKNLHDHEIVLKSNLYDNQNPVRVSLTDNKNLKSQNLAIQGETKNQRINQEISIQIANDIAYGLVIAQENGQIKYGTAKYRRVQTAILLLRRGAGLDGASRRSGVPRSVLDQLMAWGQKRPGALVEHIGW